MTTRRILEQFPAVSEDGTRYTILEIEEASEDDTIPVTSFILETGQELSQLEPDTFEIIDYGVRVYKVEESS